MTTRRRAPRRPCPRSGLDANRRRATRSFGILLGSSIVIGLAAAIASPAGASQPAGPGAAPVAARAALPVARRALPFASRALPAFGRAVAIAGDFAFVGEPGTGGGGRGAAAPGGALVHVYRREATGWRVVNTLAPAAGAAGAGLGAALAAQGSTLLVGHVLPPTPAGGGGRGGRGGGRGGAGQAAPGAVPAEAAIGSVLVYRLDGSGAWVPAGALPGGRAGAQFGAALALDGDMAVVGAPAEGDGGAVHLFMRGANGQWAAAGGLPAAGLEAGDRFGTAVAIEGGRILVGAPGREAKGAVYLFRRAGDGSWAVDGQALRSPRIADGAELGSAVALTPELIVAGAPGGTFAQPAPAGAGGGAGGAGGAGAPAAGGRGGRGSAAAPTPGLVIVFQRLGGLWREASTLAPFDIGAAQFGAATSMRGDELWIGAPGSDGIGRIYRAQRAPSGEWSTMVKLLDEDVDTNALFGAAFAVDGNTAVVGMPGDGGGGGTVAFFERTQAGDWELRSSDFPAPTERLAAITGSEISCVAGRAADFDCNSVSLLSFLPLSEIGARRGVRLSGSWGWTNPETGQDISLIGRSDGTAFVDVTDPLNPRYLGDLMRPRGTNRSTWREMKTYRNYVLIVSDGSGDRHGVQIFDLTRLRGVTAPQRFTEDAHYDLGSIHNIVVSEEAGFAYAVGVRASGENCGGGTHIIDLRDPLNPTFGGCFQDAATGRSGTGYTHDGQCVQYRGPDTRYTGREICVMSNETHISVHDMTDKSDMKVVGRATYPTAAYIHQTWFTENQSHLFLDDELDEGGFQGTAAAFGNVCPCGAAADGTRTLVWDMTDLTDPVLVREYIATTRETDHNQYVKGNRLYQSNYGAGLRVLDITDPANPREVGFMTTGGSSWSNYPFFRNGAVAFTTGSQGLFLVRDRTEPVFE